MGSMPAMSDSNSEVREEVVDVVIVGGGPTGLFAGLLLHRLGVSISILDAKADTLDLGRADALNARTQQYFEVADLLEELIPQGLKCNTSSTFSEGEFKSRQSHWWTGLEHALHKNFLMIGQPVIERTIFDKLPGSVVHHGESVVSISEDDQGVSVETQSGRKVRAKYAWAADGARSSVRSALGITFTGTKPEMLWAVLDVFIKTDFPTCPEIITFQLNGQSRVSWIPRERGLSRFYVLLDGEVTLERAQASIKEHLAPYNVEFERTEWYSTFDVKERIASTFISTRERILLGGDAAHVHSVNGGQGLNTGISDAFAAAWRLAMAVKQDASPTQVSKLLKSYDIERRSTAAGVIDVAATLVRDTHHTAKQYVSTIERTAAYITGMGISYEAFSSPLIDTSEAGIWKSGHRCPDVPLLSPTGQTKWLYQVVAYGKFLLLSVGAHGGITSASDNLAIFDILPASNAKANGNSAADRQQSDAAQIFSAEWLEDGSRCFVVVRPDMYIGYAGESLSELEAYLGKVGINIGRA